MRKRSFKNFESSAIISHPLIKHVNSLRTTFNFELPANMCFCSTYRMSHYGLVDQPVERNHLLQRALFPPVCAYLCRDVRIIFACARAGASSSRLPVERIVLLCTFLFKYFCVVCALVYLIIFALCVLLFLFFVVTLICGRGFALICWECLSKIIIYYSYHGVGDIFMFFTSSLTIFIYTLLCYSFYFSKYK